MTKICWDFNLALTERFTHLSLLVGSDGEGYEDLFGLVWFFQIDDLFY